MLTKSNPATTLPESILKATQPAVVVCGPVASGKTTIARTLAEVATLERLPSSPEGERPTVTSDEARLADLELLRRLSERDRPAIVESAALPHLLPVDNTALIVQLTASTPVRIRRLHTRWPGSTFNAARQLLELADATTRSKLRAAWGIDIAEPRANRWRADLVLGCRHVRTCPDDNACTDIVATLLTAAYNVYENYVTTHPAVDGPDALQQFAHLRRTYPEHLRRCRAALTNPVAEFSATAWRNRMLTELDTRAGLL